MNLELVVDTRSNGIWIALLRDGKLIELHEDRGNSDFAVGDIYLGRVRRVVPSLNAAFVDVGYEAYKLHKRNYKTELTNEPMSMAQCVVERSAFQLVASIIIPAIVIHTTVDVTKHLLKKVGRFQKWGPTIAGLLAIPLLPLCLDEPIEHVIEWGFHNYGPWAKPHKSHKD